MFVSVVLHCVKGSQCEGMQAVLRRSCLSQSSQARERLGQQCWDNMYWVRDVENLSHKQ